jgi:hypothetical protein
LANAHIPVQARAEALSIENFAVLWHALQKSL